MKDSVELMPAVILAGGLATRLGPLIRSIPKALVEVAGRPFLWHQLQILKRNGIRQVVLLVGYLGDKVQTPSVMVPTLDSQLNIPLTVLHCLEPLEPSDTQCHCCQSAFSCSMAILTCSAISGPSKLHFAATTGPR